MNEQTIQKLALLLSANCLRESTAEEVFSDSANQQKMELFGQQMSSRLYTFLTYLLNRPTEEYSQMVESLTKHYPQEWPLPELDEAMISTVKTAQPGEP